MHHDMSCVACATHLERLWYSPNGGPGIRLNLIQTRCGIVEWAFSVEKRTRWVSTSDRAS